MRQAIFLKRGDSDTLSETITGIDSLAGFSAKMFIVDSAGTEVDTLDGTIEGLVITYEIVNEDSKVYPIGIHNFETKIFDDNDNVFTPTRGKFVVEEVIEEDPK
jgi:hypothetical protein